MERGSTETLSDGQENPLTYEVMLSELCVIPVGSNGEPTLVCEPQTHFRQDIRIILFEILYKATWKPRPLKIRLKDEFR